jgi:hypothetical protein
MTNDARAKALAIARRRIKRLPAGEEVRSSDVRGWCYQEGIDLGDDERTTVGPLMVELKNAGLLANDGYAKRTAPARGICTRWRVRGRL